MKTIKIFLLAIIPIAAFWSCKKDSEDKAYYYGKWNVTEQQYTSVDTSYTEEVSVGAYTYDFKSNNTVNIISPGMVSTDDYWELKQGQKDSIEFSNLPSWEILESNNNQFKAKFYMNSNSHMTFTLKR